MDDTPDPIASTQGGLSPAMEDYLEAIFLLSHDSEGGACKVSEIAVALGIARPSVSKSIRRLADGGFVVHRRYGHVSLTEAGARVAQAQVRVHHILKHFLMDVLQLPEEIAEADTCRMEHAVSKATVDRLVQFVEQVDQATVELPELPDYTGSSAAGAARSWTSRV